MSYKPVHASCAFKMRRTMLRPFAVTNKALQSLSPFYSVITYQGKIPRSFGQPLCSKHFRLLCGEEQWGARQMPVEFIVW